MVGRMKKAPWPDFKGNDIYDGDVILHPSGQTGVVKYFHKYGNSSDQWRVNYEDSTGRLCLQIGDKGQAVVIKH